MLKLYPMPVEIKEKEGKYEFLYVSASGIENEVILNTYKEMGITLENEKTPNVKYKKAYSLSEEEYEIIINENGAEIIYTCESGAFYGTQTLCQLINMKTVSYLEISDKPLLKDRILSLDVSRGKIPTMKHFKEIIDYLATARYNVLMLYYDRIVFQFPSLEGLWEDDAITIDELWQIKKWCNERFMKFTISVESFGHLANFLKTDRFKHLSNSPDPQKPCGDLYPYHPEVMDFIDMLVSDVMPFCDTDFLVIHGDEVATLKTGKTKEAVEEKGEITVYMEHMQKVCDLVINKYQKIPMIAEDMFMKRNSTIDEITENLKKFPKGAIVEDWGYEQEYEYHKFQENNKILKKMEIPFINLASTGLFSQYVARTYNQTLNAEVACRSAYENGGRGACQTTWGDDGNSQFFVSELGGIFTFGSTAWNHKAFQLSYVHEFLNKYIYKAENCDFAGIAASFGEAAWYTKGKCPDSNQFVFASHCSYDNDILWNGYHAHTGINPIRLNDMVDVYGCEKAIKFVLNLRGELENTVLKCENGELLKEKLLLNVRMFEFVIRLSYFKLCIHSTKDYDKAKELILPIRFCADEIILNFTRLWKTENRDFFGDKYPNGLKAKIKAFDEFIEKTPELKA